MVRIRPARTEEGPELSALCLRSKAHWGYDAAFLELAREPLTITAEMIADHPVLVAEGPNGNLLGTVSAMPHEGSVWLLSLLFIDPVAIGMGLGRSLFHAMADLVRQKGGARFEIHSDPYALPFYEYLGAVVIGEVGSNAIPGRKLPLMSYALI